MDNKFLLLDSALNMLLNIHIKREARILELQKIKLYTNGLINLPEEKKKQLTAVLEAFAHEICRDTVDEDCIGGYHKILKEILNINRSVKGKKCVVFGDNWLAEEMQKKLGSMGYCVFHWHVLNPDYINEFDLYVLCDEPVKAYEISSIQDKDKIIRLWNHLKYKFILSPPFYKTYMEYKSQRDKKVKCMVTGTTNIKNAVQSSLMHIKTVSLANNAQDLFYDYKMFCHTIKSLPELKYAVIGLTPFSLRYDASKSKVEWRRCLIYYPIVKTMHNCSDSKALIEAYETENAKINDFFEEDYIDSLYNVFAMQDKSLPESSFDVYGGDSRSKELVSMNEREIKQLYDKPFPDILKENIEILEEYVKCCTEKGIKAILFIPPYSQWYKENMKQEYYEELKTETERLCSKYDACLVDLCKMPVPDCCFSDYANVNNLGAVKAASYLNEIFDRTV